MTVPLPLRVLEYFKKTGESEEKDIKNAIGEGNLKNTLDNLVNRKILVQDGKNYKIGPNFDLIYDKIFMVHERVNLRPDKKLLIRGLFSQARFFRQDFFFKIVEGEGFSKKEVEEFLESEKKYVRLVKTVCIGTETGPPFLHNLRIFSETDCERMKRYYGSYGLVVHEEKYLKGDYPEELLKPAKEYIKERKDLRNKMKEEMIFSMYTSIYFPWERFFIFP
ncbi:MAG: hypothetical protein ACXQS7_06545 [Candidatus Syntropharchaeia archaeon]